MAWQGITVFDLDDTLYLERDFARSGFAAAGRWLEQEGGPAGLADMCLRLFEDGRRGRIFDEAVETLGIGSDPACVRRLIEIYRGHRPDIALAPDAARYLADPQLGPLALITDGRAATQRAKVMSLGIQERFGLIVYTGALGPGRGKPHPDAFMRVEEWAKPGPLSLVYVADNPLKDFVTPRARGWWTVQIVRPDRVHRVAAPDAAHAAHAQIVTLDALEECLNDLAGGIGPVVGTFPTNTHGRFPVS
jgi:putative hydrolase of the HAD superfamily